MRKLLLSQLFITFTVAILFTTYNPISWIAALYGGVVAIINSLILAQGLNIATKSAPQNSNRGMLILYLSAVIRFMLVMIFFAIGIGLFKWLPIPMIVAFSLTQFATLFLQLFASNKKMENHVDIT